MCLLGTRHVTFISCARQPSLFASQCVCSATAFCTTTTTTNPVPFLPPSFLECINDRFQSLTNDTLYFMSTLNQTLTCFDRYQQVLASMHSQICAQKWNVCPFFAMSPQGNHTELCKNCKSAYKGLNELYSSLEKNDSMCIDIEDGVRTPFFCSFIELNVLSVKYSFSRLLSGNFDLFAPDSPYM